jgi:hypothetical protein
MVYDTILRIWAYSLGLSLALGVYIVGVSMMRFYDRVIKDPESAGMAARVITLLIAVVARQPILGRYGIFASHRKFRGAAALVRKHKYDKYIYASFQVTLAFLIASTLILELMDKP